MVKTYRMSTYVRGSGGLEGSEGSECPGNLESANNTFQKNSKLLHFYLLP